MKTIRLDGGTGTVLQAMGLAAGKDPCDWNLENPEAVAAMHRAYLESGSQIILANTFGCNRLKYHGSHALGELVSAAIAIARREAAAKGAKVALDVGPSGRLLAPAGDLSFDEAFDAFAEAIRFGGDRSDLIFIETIGDLNELKAAVIAAKTVSHLPVYVSVALDVNGKLLTGGSVEAFAVLMESLGVDAYGFNCGLGPDRMLPFVDRLAAISTKPIIVKPNAGMPRLVDGRTVFDVDPEEFAKLVRQLAEHGASIIGGCCGTTPAHIRSLDGIEAIKVSSSASSPRTMVSSLMDAFEIVPYRGIIIGERLNPTGKKALKEAYARGDVSYVLREAVTQLESGAELLDVNCGVPGLDERELLSSTVLTVQTVATCPIEIDTADPAALEDALRKVAGKPLVNSVNGKRESMDAVFPLVKKYGGALVALCLDESGIPSTAEGRLAIARKILAEGEKYGFTKDDFLFDALTLSVSSDPKAAMVTLETVRRLTEELKVNTVLGVSNVSFGLPDRAALNNAMYSLAKKAGLSAAIANPSAIRDELLADAEDVLMGRDEGCAKWIAAHSGVSAPSSVRSSDSPTVAYAIRHGFTDDAGKAAAAALQSGSAPLEIIDSEIVPALEEVGRGFEKGTVFLPQLLRSADAAGVAFAAVKAAMPSDCGLRKGATAVLATVKGDIHDIGKNIVRALLENYGFDVIDLGRDVAPETIVSRARESGAKMVGLSALMTTTVGAMADTIRLLRESGLKTKVCVGGAVVTQEYADSIGADYYAKDAMATVRYMEGL